MLKSRFFAAGIAVCFSLNLSGGFIPAHAVEMAPGNFATISGSSQISPSLPALQDKTPLKEPSKAGIQEFVPIETEIGQITALDTSALNDRTPLLLVHGILGENNRYNHWENFVKYTRHHLAFNRKFKIYLYKYNSTESVPTISKDLTGALKAFIMQTGSRKFQILAYSEGGLLSRNAMSDPLIRARAGKVITIGSPFHGSPLANASWLKQELKSENFLSPVRVANKISYWVARKMIPSFEKDFHWDNFDHALLTNSLKASVDSLTPLRGQPLSDGRSLADQIDEQPALSLFGSAAHWNLDNFTTYGSYFGADDQSSDILLKELGIRMNLPKERSRLVGLLSRHIFICLIRDNIAKLPIAQLVKKAEKKTSTEDSLNMSDENAPNSTLLAVNDTMEKLQERPKDVLDVKQSPLTKMSKTLQSSLSPSRVNPLMAYNDGISPITSTLWLGRYMDEFSNLKDPVARSWAALKKLKSSSNARLFASLDHRDWMEGITRTQETKVVDLLHPEQGRKTVFEWLVQDLMTQQG